MMAAFAGFNNKNLILNGRDYFGHIFAQKDYYGREEM